MNEDTDDEAGKDLNVPSEADWTHPEVTSCKQDTIKKRHVQEGSTDSVVDLNDSRNSGSNHSKLMEARICSTTEAETKKTDAKTDTLAASADNQRQQTHGERGRGAVQTNEDRHEAAGGNKCAHDASAHLNKEREKRASKSERKRAKKKQQRNNLISLMQRKNKLKCENKKK